MVAEGPGPPALVVSLFIGPKAREPLREVDEVVAVPGRGLRGDRKFRSEGIGGTKQGPDREITLIEEEAVAAVQRDARIDLLPIETRRNVLTRGVALNHLVGRRFRVGSVELEGLRLCEPCDHLEALTRPGVRAALVHRGGLRARILAEGVIRKGDPITLP